MFGGCVGIGILVGIWFLEVFVQIDGGYQVFVVVCIKIGQQVCGLVDDGDGELFVVVVVIVVVVDQWYFIDVCVFGQFVEDGLCGFVIMVLQGIDYCQWMFVYGVDVVDVDYYVVVVGKLGLLVDEFVEEIFDGKQQIVVVIWNGCVVVVYGQCMVLVLYGGSWWQCLYYGVDIVFVCDVV